MQQQFSIDADSAHIPNGVKFTGTADNLQFQEYTTFMNVRGQEIAGWQQDLSKARSKKDSTAIREKIRKGNEAVIIYRAGIEKKSPESMLTTLLRVLHEPVVPPQPPGPYDSNFAYHYYKNHYWDSVSFTDERLIRTSRSLNPSWTAITKTWYRPIRIQLTGKSITCCSIPAQTRRCSNTC